uniref:(northern house mosquito) hypothetical protein n=1 Tax=Culex pipiens TaxID=7175 RepID=A0A8D8P4I4_CULPI
MALGVALVLGNLPTGVRRSGRTEPVIVGPTAEPIKVLVVVVAAGVARRVVVLGGCWRGLLPAERLVGGAVYGTESGVFRVVGGGCNGVMMPVGVLLSAWGSRGFLDVVELEVGL